MYSSNAQSKRIREERKELEQEADDVLLFYKEEIRSQEEYLSRAHSQGDDIGGHSSKYAKVSGIYQSEQAGKEPLFDSLFSLAPSTPEPQRTRPSLHRSTMSWTCGPILSTSPVCRSAYSSLPRSCAATDFLANFAADSDTAEANPVIQEGSVVSHYCVGRLIGSGSYSECREGYDLKDPARTPLAFKIVHQDEGGSSEHEIEIWRRLRHPGFLPLIDIIKLGTATTVIVCPLAINGNMLQYLSKNGPFSAEQARRMFQELSQAINYLHNEAGIIHRDIKLENILLDEALNTFICDFGLSEHIEAAVWRDENEEDMMLMKGSFWYLPPEVIDSSLSRQSSKEALKQPRPDQGATAEVRRNRTKADVWSLGVVLYAMVSGHLPFSDDFLPRLQIAIINGEYPELGETIDKDIRDLISHTLTVDLDARPTIADVLQHPWLRLS